MCVQDDEAVLQKLEAALAAGPDPELDALTKVIDESIWQAAGQAGRHAAYGLSGCRSRMTCDLSVHLASLVSPAWKYCMQLPHGPCLLVQPFL
jgi:hypothetical protein